MNKRRQTSVEIDQDARAVNFQCPLLPCWDEADDGVPDFPCFTCKTTEGEPPIAWWKVFNHENRYTNDNLIMIIFGNVGFTYFDKHRKFYMGLAMWSTLLSIAFTIAGACAVSTDNQTVMDTHWAWIRVKNATSGDISILFLGLRSLVYKHDPCDVDSCTNSGLIYDDIIDRSTDYLAEKGISNDFIANGLNTCIADAVEISWGNVLTCVTLVFALLGTINRMKFSSDANIQKALGMITDLCGFISLTSTLLTYRDYCVVDIPSTWTDKWDNKIKTEIWLGPGYACYLVCLFGSFMRAVMHWLTPLPGRGAGCRLKLPNSLMEKLDENGDGELSWAEIKHAYRNMKKKRTDPIATDTNPAPTKSQPDANTAPMNSQPDLDTTGTDNNTTPAQYTNGEVYNEEKYCTAPFCAR